ncbi:hypothetical protein BDQ12DRAFT_737089 [Crucibulum laeve]|uniref:Beach-domain-containing protein n=1 Tax=Crucibulum laeve TaxID=68775 RepID=A0A5C3LSP6_9AGAR|nr:hypothetical protein BDQ12DRAFT_737089 [Crucibulum laeve]
MFKSLLTPLRARFDVSPRTPTVEVSPNESDEQAPEDFARDVLVELMRNSVENLKFADNSSMRSEILSEIQRIMLQDACTKDVFREMDGFLVLMSVLSTTNVEDRSNGSANEKKDQALQQIIDSARLVFMILSEAMFEHEENAKFFRNHVGYESLALALQGLMSNSTTAEETMGFLLSLALHDFSLSGIFTGLIGMQEHDLIDIKVSEFASHLSIIRHSGAMSVLWNFIPQLTDADSCLRYGVFKLFEVLSQLNHRNQAILSSLGLVKSVFSRFYETRDDVTVSEKERYVLQKLLRRLLDMGATTLESRPIFQKAVKEDESLDPEILDVIRFGMRSRWPEHFSMESSAALTIKDKGFKGLPATGFTFMTWLWLSELPRGGSHALFSASQPSRSLLSLRLSQDGKLELSSSQNNTPAVFSKIPLRKGRWIHITLVHYPHRATNPSIRLFIDGILADTVNWAYPKFESSQPGAYTIGDTSTTARLSWCLASAFLLACPLGDDIPRLIHHLGPRYSGSFQDPAFVKFLTYEASTSLNMFLSTVDTKNRVQAELSQTMKAIRHGFGIPESQIVFAFCTAHIPLSGEVSTVPINGLHDQLEIQGDVFIAKAASLDVALWKIGGAAVALRLVQLANTPHELSRTLGILTDGLKNNWQNSDDMERLRGYEILADILRINAQKLNLTGFETLFEFLGINFRSPEQSTIVNVVAYRAIALDFELWSRTRSEIQHAHLEHFTTLLQTSRYKNFNIKQRLAKTGLVRKLLFALQMDWYHRESMGYLLDALCISWEAHFSKDDAIKPVVSFIAANLQEDMGNASPRSIISPVDGKRQQEAATVVLGKLVATLSIPAYYTKFIAALPITRICLLLLGERPSSFVATQILTLIAIGIGMSSSFTRKFELVSGWNVLKTVLPFSWDLSVHEVAFNILLGRYGDSKSPNSNGNSTVVCPQIFPAILSALQSGLISVTNRCHISEDEAIQSSWTIESAMELLVEELMNLHTSSPTFRQIFRSQQTTQLFIEAYKNFVTKISPAPQLNLWTSRILEKLTHLGLALALDNAVGGSQKREILDIIQSAETILNPTAEKTTIDPHLIVDSRTIRQRIASARFSMQVGERTVIKTISRMLEWRKTVQISERKRLRKNILDLREQRRQISRLTEWTDLLQSERGLWPNHGPRLWQLDETEGPHRIRKKLEIQNEKSSISRVEAYGQHLRDIHLPDSDAQSIIHAEVPPWAESYEISATDMDDKQLADDIVDDKLRRIRHELEPGDVIEAVGTVARIAGVDSSPGLLILGRTHIYMLDGVVENDDGEVIDAHDAPKRLLFVPGSIVELDGPQKAQRWAHDQIATYRDKKFLFRDVALEIYFKDSRSLLVVFLDKKKRYDIDQRLSVIITRSSESAAMTGALRTPLFGRMGPSVLSGFREDELSTATRKWQAREISNFTYLSILNQISGRTPSDATQYPVFPWVLQNYTSQTLDLSSPESYRDLTKPMGALTPARREAASVRYSNLKSVDEEPFHYGTHFSSSMIVCHFLIRMAPFTSMFKTLQGGDWDLPDRLFSDLPRAYDSAANDTRGDVRELIPEFYTCPEFLENSANLNFGVQQATGERIHDVKLPLWARQDPLLFIVTNRKALESSYVSEHLPAWIDLIWGCKQRDEVSLNVFHPLSYEGSIDLDSIKDDLEREATVGIIHNFGQTPRKIFSTPHPERFTTGSYTLPIGTLHGIEEDPHLLIQGSRCFRDLGPTVPVRELIPDVIGDKVIPCPAGVLSVPMYPHEQVEWQAGHTQLRLVIDHKAVQTVEDAFCNCAAFADSNSLVTGSSDYTVRLWNLSRHQTTNSPSPHLTLSHIMRIHTDEVVSVTASKVWSLVVSGSKDGSVALWDLNRGIYVRSIWHGEGGESSTVNLVAINESTGYIATCSRSKLSLHTINARPIATLDLTSTPCFSALVPSVTAIAFHEREYSPLGILATGSPDGTITLRTWTADGTPKCEKAQWEFVTVRTMKVRMVGRGVNRPPGVTSLRFLGENLYHGEEIGKTYVWSLPE